MRNCIDAPILGKRLISMTPSAIDLHTSLTIGLLLRFCKRGDLSSQPSTSGSNNVLYMVRKKHELIGAVYTQGATL